MRKGKLYTLLMGLCLCSYVWIACSINNTDGQGLWQGCLSKQFLHIPCPSCGITRALMEAIRGNFMSAMLINPLWLVAGVGLSVAPVWILLDWTVRNDSLYRCYSKILLYVEKKCVYIPLTLLLIANWIWNIIKFT